MDESRRAQADHFIAEQIDSVPHLEALLLIWNRRPHGWPLDEMAQSLYLSREMTARILDDLVRRSVISAGEGDEALYGCEIANEEMGLLLQDVDYLYRTELLRITGIIHSKGSAGMRDFARAFRLKKDRD